MKMMINGKAKANPWKGASQYTENDKLYGRDYEVYDLFNLIDNHVFVTLYGKSGTGKSSLLQAGLFPRLRENNYIPIYIRLGALSTNESIPKFLIKEAGKYIDKEFDYIIDNQKDDEASDFLWNYFARHSFKNDKENNVSIVFVLDQFEEVFRTRKKDADILMRQIDYMASGYHTLANIELPNGTQYNYSQNYRFVAAIREDELYRLEDCLDNNYLLNLKQHRLRLRGLSPNAVEDVILIPGKDCIDKESSQAVVDKIKSVIKNEDDTYNTLLLSIICYQLFEELKDGEKINSVKVQSIDGSLDSYYESIMKEVPSPERRYIEQKMVDGNYRVPVSLAEFEENVKIARYLYKSDRNDKRIIHDISIPDKPVHVELIHDQIAEVIRRKRQKENQLWMKGLLYTILGFAIILLGLFTLIWGDTTSNKNKLTSSLVRCEDHDFSTKDTMWIDDKILSRNSLVEHFKIYGKKQYTIQNCSYLSIIDISEIGQDTFNLNLQNCPLLNKIIMPDHLSLFVLDVEECPNLQIHINKGLGSLRINASRNGLSVMVDEDVDKFIWQDHVLWDMQLREPIYCSGNSNHIRTYFPSGISSARQGELEWRTRDGETVTFANINSKNDANYSTSCDLSNIPPRSVKESIKGRSYFDGITLPNSMDYLDEKLFYCFPNLSTITIPQSVARIEKSAFEMCTSLKSVELPMSLQLIGDSAFKDCRRLKQIEIPASVKYIGNSAFAGCDSLESIVFKGDFCQIGKRVFANCISMKTLVLPSNVQYNTTGGSLFDNPFYNCPKDIIPQNFRHIIADLKTGKSLISYGDSLYVINIESNQSTLHFPEDEERHVWVFDKTPFSLTDIYIPYPQPEIALKGHHELSKFGLILNDELKGKITLHIPNGCRRYYESSPDFSRFRQIKEEEVNFTIAYLKSVTNDFLWLTLFLVFAFILWTTIGFLKLKHNKEHNSDNPSFNKCFVRPGLSMALCSFVIAVVFFLFFNLIVGYSTGISVIIGCFCGTILGLICFFIGDIHKWFNQNNALPALLGNFKIPESRKSLLLRYARHFILFLVLLCIVVVSIRYAIVAYNNNKNIDYVLSNKDYPRALSIVVDRILHSDIACQDDIDMLNNLLKQLGERSNIVTDKNVTIPAQEIKQGNVKVEISEFDNGLYVWRQDSLFIWNKNTYFNKIVPYKDLGFTNYPNVDFENLYLYSYNSQSDSSLILDLIQPDLSTYIIPGEIDANYGHRYSSKYIMSIDKQGKKYLFDKQGRGGIIINPYSPYLGSVNFELKNDNNSERLFIGYTDSTGPVCKRFDNGESKGVFNDNKFLVWYYQTENKIDILDITDSFKIVKTFESINGYVIRCADNVLVLSKNNQLLVYDYHLKDDAKLDGELFGLLGDYVYYGKGRNRYVYNVSTGKSTTIPIQYSGKSVTPYYQGSRYLVLYDYDYKETFVLDSEKEFELIFKESGSCSSGTNYCEIEKGDSVRLLYFDRCFFKSARIPKVLMHNIVGKFLVKSQWVQDDNCNHYVICPLIDFSKLYELKSKDGNASLSRPIISDNHILQKMSCANGDIVIKFYRYEGLEDMIKKCAPSLLNEKVKNALIEKLPK